MFIKRGLSVSRGGLDVLDDVGPGKADLGRLSVLVILGAVPEGKTAQGGVALLHSRDTIRCEEMAYIHSRFIAASCRETYMSCEVIHMRDHIYARISSTAHPWGGQASESGKATFSVNCRNPYRRMRRRAAIKRL